MFSTLYTDMIGSFKEINEASGEKMTLLKGDIMQLSLKILLLIPMFFVVSCDLSQMKRAERVQREMKKDVEKGIRKATKIQIKAGKYLKKKQVKYQNKIRKEL